jgi:hypothetical protein
LKAVRKRALILKAHGVALVARRLALAGTALRIEVSTPVSFHLVF